MLPVTPTSSYKFIKLDNQGGKRIYRCYNLSCRTPSDGERYIFVDDGNKVEVEAICHFRLLLKTGCNLDLEETYVVLSFR